MIVSAPRSTFSGMGITDMIFMYHTSFSRHENYHELLEKISDSYRTIIDGLGMSFDIDAEISALKKDL